MVAERESRRRPAQSILLGMRTFTLTTPLDAPAEAVWGAIFGNGQAFRLVTRGLLRFPASSAWDRPLQRGDVLAGLLWLGGVLPGWRHTIVVDTVDHDHRTLVTEEHGGPLRRWRHTITVEADHATRCHYTDRLDIDAGRLTGAVTAAAVVFYRVRQRRWRRLAPALGAARTVA
jgi:ligand-binding SRPBCC domain-containing protein